MGRILEQFGLGLAGNVANTAVGAIMGQAFAGANDRRQIRQQQKLTDMQLNADQKMGEFNRQQQMRMWEDTNYSAQMGQLEKAGLNPGLIYGMGGGGGATAQSSPGQVHGANAPSGGGEQVAMAQTMAQMGLMRAQTENVNANTEKTKAETKNTPLQGDQIQMQTDSLAQGIENQKAQWRLTTIDTELRQVQASVARQTILDQMQAIENEAKKGVQVIKQLQLENQLNEAQMGDKIEILKTNAIGALIENALKTEQITKTKEEVKQITQKILQDWTKLDIEAQDMLIKKTLGEYEINHPQILKVLGGAIQRLANSIAKPLPGDTIPETKNK